MRIGRLRHRITHQQRTATQHGEPSQWATVGTYWAAVAPMPSAEAVAAQQQIQEVVTHQVTLRGGKTISLRDRFLLGNRVLNIVDIQNVDERDIQLNILCREVKNA